MDVVSQFMLPLAEICAALEVELARSELLETSISGRRPWNNAQQRKLLSIVSFLAFFALNGYRCDANVHEIPCKRQTEG